MAQRLARFCPYCRTENPPDAERCRACGLSLYALPGDRWLLLNEIARLVDEGVIPQEAYQRTSERYAEESAARKSPPAPPKTSNKGFFWLGIAILGLGFMVAAAGSVGGVYIMFLGIGFIIWGLVSRAPEARRVPPAPLGAPAPRAAEPYHSPQPLPQQTAPAPEPHAAPAAYVGLTPERAQFKLATWLPEQEANLLLYLGAFLIVIATLVLVGSSQQTIGQAGNMALLVAGTAAFLIAGLVCLRSPRIRQAGLVFIAVSAVLFPLNFVGVYAFFLDEKEIDATGLWLGGSLASAFFYGAVSFLGVGRSYPLRCGGALVSALMAFLVLVDAPVEAYPACFICLGLALAVPALFRMGRVSQVLGKLWLGSAHVVVLASYGGALLLRPESELTIAGQKVLTGGYDLGWTWFGASLAGMAFFAIVAPRGPAVWQSWAAVASLTVFLASSLTVAGADAESYLVAFTVLAAALVLPSVFRLPGVSLTFGLPALTFGYLAGTGALLGSLVLATRDEPVAYLWYLPATLAVMSGFFWLQTLAYSNDLLGDIGLWRALVSGFDLVKSPDLRPALALCALVASGATAVSLVYALALDVGWYGPALMLVAGAYAAAAVPWRPEWPGQPFPGWLALAAASVAWTRLASQGTAAQAASLGLAAVVLYMVLARLFQADERVIAVRPVLAWLGAKPRASLSPLVVGALTYASGMALSFGFFHLLETTGVVDTSDAIDVAYAYFYLSLALTAAAATTRWWWREVRPHVYGVALVMAVLVTIAAAGYEDKAPLALTVYAAVTFVVAIWESQPLGLGLAASFASFAVLAGWRSLEPRDAYAPLALTAIGSGLVLAGSYVGARVGRYGSTLLPVGMAVMALAPAAALVKMAVLLDPTAVSEEWPHDPTLLIQMAVAAALVAAAVWAVASRLLRKGEVVVAAALVGLLAGLIAAGRLGPEYLEHPDYATAMHAAGFAFFLVAAIVVATRPEMAVYAPAIEAGAVSGTEDAADRLTASEVREARRWTVIGLIYAAGAALNVAFYYFLVAANVLDSGDAVAVSWAFFGLTCAEAAIAVTARWAWPDIRIHVFLVAIATSLFSLISAVDLEGQVTLLLALYSAIAVALSVWEREPLGLGVAAAYAFVTVFAARRYFEADETALPLLLSAMGCLVLAASLLLRKAPAWALTSLVIAFAYAAIAPLVAWLAIIRLADDRGYIDGTYFLASDIYQAGVLALAVLGALVAAGASYVRDVRLAALSSLVLLAALLLEIAHFQPDNVQAYTIPVGLYCIGATLVVSRYGWLPEENAPALDRLYGVGPAIVMLPSFFQSLHAGAWEYGLVLLLESVAFLALALLLRRTWMLTIAVTFVVANALHYLFFTPGLPTWATLAIAGVLLMIAGTAVLFGRDRWPAIQRDVSSWWQKTPTDGPTTRGAPQRRSLAH